MDKEEIIEVLEERLAKLKKESPDAFVPIGAYERVISDLLSED